MMAATWFHDLGVHVFPTRDKVPAVPRGSSWKDYRTTRAAVALFKEYGVPLGPLAVADSDSQAAETWSAQHLPPTPLVVTTGRGRHRYYRRPVGAAPRFIHRDGLTIEFRHEGQYVVGPGSVRPDGVVYQAAAWSWDIRDVPIFPVDDFRWDDRPVEARGSVSGARFELPPVVHAGERHEQLFKLLRSCRAKGWDRETTRELVSLANQGRCVPPLVEDPAFEDWFNRQWRKVDRPYTPPLANLNGLRGI